MTGSILNEVVYAGEPVWVLYDPTPGQSQCGDYGYLNAYAKNRDEAKIGGKVYVKGKINTILWHYRTIQFNILISNSDYIVGIKEPERIFLTL